MIFVMSLGSFCWSCTLLQDRTSDLTYPVGVQVFCLHMWSTHHLSPSLNINLLLIVHNVSSLLFNLFLEVFNHLSERNFILRKLLQSVVTVRKSWKYHNTIHADEILTTFLWVSPLFDLVYNFCLILSILLETLPGLERLPLWVIQNICTLKI